MKLHPSTFYAHNFAWGLVTLSLLGCGSHDYSLAKVSGTITLNGKPVSNASVTFVPIGDGAGPASLAVTDANGNFELHTLDLDLPGAVIGNHRVTVSTARASSADERATISRELAPPQFRDGSFHFEVLPDGTNAADIKMQSKRK